MRRNPKELMVALSVVVGLTAGACGGGEPRPARAPSATRVATTTITSDALTTSATVAGPTASNGSSSAAPAANASPSATSVNTATPAASAALRIATARCDREAACDNVGTGRSFGDRDECVSQIGHDVVTNLSSEECPSGVAANSLATCIADVGSAPCGEEEEGVVPSSCSRERVCLR